jgi:uncharacterized protein YecE (DUF72 family)
MDFGKLSNISSVDFTLPPDAPQTKVVLQKNAKQPGKPAIYVGCPIWTNKDWLGKIYPSSAKEKDFLFHYSRQFNTIELNTTHYQIPDTLTIERWKEAAAPGFTFSPKFPQIISHEKQLDESEDETLAFCEAIRGLGEHLGTSFLQLAPNFSPKYFPLLEKYVKFFPRDISLAIEFRHQDWFKPSPITSKTFDLLEQYNIGTVITDVAGRRDVLHQRLTTSTAMIRFVGNGLHATDYSRVNDWIDRCIQWIEAGLQTLYFFVHEPDNKFSPELVAYFIQHINEKGNFQLTAPRITPQPVQGTLF